MTRYSVHVTYGNLGFVTKVEANSVEEANVLAVELGTKEFGPNLDEITYKIEEAIDGDL
jgi:hypothetical protein